MPVHIQWDNDDKTAIRYDYEGKWSWDELYDVSKKAVEMFHSVNHKVNVIHNLANSPNLPSGALSHAHRFSAQNPENWGISVVVGTSAFVSSLIQVFRKVYRQFGERYYTAMTLEQARQVLAQHQPSAKK
jgi:hypothetical protein